MPSTQDPSVNNNADYPSSRIEDRRYWIFTQINNWLGSDGITIGGVRNAIIDHCSFNITNDEAVDISRSSALTISELCTWRDFG